MKMRIFKKRILLISIIFLGLDGLISYSQDNIGIGIIRFDFNKTTIVDFYDKVEGKVNKRLSFYEQDKNIDVFDKQHYGQIDWIEPEFGKAFDGDGIVNLFVLRCKQQIGQWFEVIANKDNGQTYWIRQCNYTKFKTWEDYLKGMLIIRMLNTNNGIFYEPKQNATRLKLGGENCFRATAMEGDWIKIIRYTNCLADLTLDKKPIGWIKWRNMESLLIEYDPW